jgi:hypothetical protein
MPPESVNMSFALKAAYPQIGNWIDNNKFYGQTGFIEDLPGAGMHWNDHLHTIYS